MLPKAYSYRLKSMSSEGRLTVQLGDGRCNVLVQVMSGNHWVATYVKNNNINYFDSFHMPPFNKWLIVLKKMQLDSFTPE